MKTLLLRRLVAADAPALCALEERGYVPTLSEAGYRHELGANALARYWGLQEDEALIAYAGTWLIADEVHVSILVVDPDHRRRGLGEFLLLHLLLDGAERGGTMATLEVRRSNQPAQALYARWGFTTVAERPRYYRDGEDGLVMLLDLRDDAAQQTARSQRHATLQKQLALAAPITS